jgi:trehalose 6-phosphate phosphatase
VISGRARADVAARLPRVPLFAVVGNHGAEAGHGPLDRTRRVRILRWRSLLQDALCGVRGVEIEDKRFSLAVHYRAAPARAVAQHAVLHAAAALDGVRVFGGRAVVNLVPDDAPDKGTALAELVERSGAPHALYLGDDRTDESVFRSAAASVAVRVGRTDRSAASFYVPGQGAVDDLLRALLDARTRLDGLGERGEQLARALGA